MFDPYCRHCGAKLGTADRYCIMCGKLNCGDRSDPATATKKALTKAIVDKDLHNKRNSVFAYIGQFLILCMIIFVVCLGQPAILLLFIFWVLNVIRMIRGDIRKSKCKYYILERTCLHKDHYTDDDIDALRLWFDNADGTLYISCEVKSDFYEQTNPGDNFYIVILKKENTPILCYRTSEWFLP